MMRGAGSSGRFSLILLALVVSACGARSGAIRAARHHNQSELRAELLKARAEGRLNRSLSEDVARALLEGELERSRGRPGAEFVGSLDACSRELRGALDDRTRFHDEAGGAALLLLVEDGAEERRARSYESDEVALYRVAFARALSRPEDASLRIELYADPDERVRRAALDAAFGSVTQGELFALAETARLDPDPLCQSKALRLLGTVEGPESLSILLDRYASSTEREQLSVLEGIFGQASASKRAQDELFSIATSASGLVRLSAALLLLRVAETSPLESERRQTLHNIVTEFARSGAASEQVLALRSLPRGEPETRKLLLTATESTHEDVRLLALERLLSDQSEGRAAEKKLLTLAQSDSPVGRDARDLLGHRGHEQILPFVLRDATHRSAEVRLRAARTLLALDRWDHASLLLADRDPSVQRELACRVLASP